MDILGIVFACVGALVASAGGIWFLIATFKKGVGWGLANLFLPFASLAFLCMHFQDAWKPSLVNLVGVILIGIGLAMIIPTHPELFNQKNPFEPPSITDAEPTAANR